ncbi:MAG: hypothetical protein LQ338_006315 [Usnochroma carphineum]|nr:MAG: hypothetical protein LQ338_006315 [Usnochroma carphineum]
MAPSLPSLDVRRFRSYLFRLPLFLRIVLVFIGIFWILELQQIWDVVKWGALIPKEINIGTMYRLNTYPLIHRGFFHALLNTLALVPLLERFEAEHGTLLTGAMFVGPLSTLPAAGYLLVERGIFRQNAPILGVSIWVFVLLGVEGIKTFKSNPYFSISTFRIPTWTTPLVILLFTTALVPGTSLLGHLCSVGVGYAYGLGYLKLLAPPEKVLRWIEGKLNLLGRLPHYVSIDQKTYGDPDYHGVEVAAGKPSLPSIVLVTVSSRHGWWEWDVEHHTLCILDDTGSPSASLFQTLAAYLQVEVVQAPTVLALRRDPRLLKVPPYLSAILVVIGVVWLLLLPLNEYSRHTYISENALLPGQVHTYFGGSEQNVFNAYKYEVQAVTGRSHEEIAAKLSDIFQSIGLKAAKQKYEYHAAGNTYRGENAYAVLHAPRGDATEAIVLVAAWTNMDGELNQSGVALALTLARYFKRWSLWSKDIIVLVTSDSKAGPQAWVDAYHDEHSPLSAASLPLKSGALQGVVVVDKAFDHGFESLHIVYDGINGQLPNLDLFNSAVHIASGQMGIGIALQRMWTHDDSYRARLQTMLRGMVSQGLGHTSGPHSSFIPYHVDAITLQAVGNGWQDEMAMGRCVESTFRSLNNLLEHFHQSFFFYLLMQAQRFVSIGTYLPSAMLVAVNFTIMAIALWILSGRPPPKPRTASTAAEKARESEFEVVEKDGMVAVVPKEEMAIVERQLFLPIALVVSFHFLGAIPLYVFNNTRRDMLSRTLIFSALANVFLPTFLALLVSGYIVMSSHRLILLQCFSLLLLGMFLATLATLNFSLAFLIGLLAAPLSFAGVPMLAENGDAPLKLSLKRKVICNVVLHLLSPPVVVLALCKIFGVAAGAMLAEAAFGWKVSGLWTQVVVCCVWWPAWLVGAVIVSPML